MPIIQFRNENGVITETEIVTRNVVIAEFDADSASGATDDLEPLLEPAVPQRIEYDDEGSMSSITTVCGETENRRESDEGISYVLEGIIVEEQLTAAKNISSGDNLTLVSDLHSGPIAVQRVTIEQNSDVVYFKPNNSAEWELAFSFQMQFQQPDTTA